MTLPRNTLSPRATWRCARSSTARNAGMSPEIRETINVTSTKHTFTARNMEMRTKLNCAQRWDVARNSRNNKCHFHETHFHRSQHGDAHEAQLRATLGCRQKFAKQ